MDIERAKRNIKYKKRIFLENMKKDIRDLERDYVFNQIRFDYQSDVLYQIVKTKLLFKIDEISGRKELDVPEDIKYKLDYSNVSFKDVDIKDYDFTNMENVYINPQEIFKKDMRGCILNGVSITGNLDDVYITRTDFTNSIGAIIDPQTIYENDLRETKLTNTLVINDFNDVKISRTIFDGADIIDRDKKDYINESIKEYVKKR